MLYFPILLAFYLVFWKHFYLNLMIYLFFLLQTIRTHYLQSVYFSFITKPVLSTQTLQSYPELKPISKQVFFIYYELKVSLLLNLHIYCSLYDREHHE